MFMSMSMTSAVTSARHPVETQALTLENKIYESQHLRGEIVTCQKIDCYFLTRMAREECEGDGDGDGNGESVEAEVAGEGKADNDNDKDNDK